jgi:hypothetical protein
MRRCDSGTLLPSPLVVGLSQVTACGKGSASGMRQLVLYELACDGGTVLPGPLVVGLSQVTLCGKGSASGMRQLVLYELACDGVCSMASNCVVQSCAGMTLQG